MPQYRDLTQGIVERVYERVSKKRQALIDREKNSYKNPVCEFCETPYNESKTDECYQCDCMREGRRHPHMKTLRETPNALKELRFNLQ